MALLHLLEGQDFAVAHVDHGWREESGREAEELRQKVEAMGYRFHLKKLGPVAGNLESACRHERLQFFKELCLAHGYRAVVLAHHANDQAETVLKRLLEGHPLPSLGAMRAEGEWQGMKIIRPLLHWKKSEIPSVDCFDDPTNRDLKFLRAKMREMMGKEVAEPLCRIAAQAQELADYLDDQIAFVPIVEGAMGLMVELPELPPILQKHLVRRFCERGGLHPGFHQVERLLKGENALPGLEVDRGRLFIPRVDPLAESVELTPGRHSFGGWRVKVSHAETPETPGDWMDLWKSSASVTLPEGCYSLAPPINGPYLGQTPLAKWWSNHKVPTFLRRSVPILLKQGTIQHEFLTGRFKSLEKNLLPLIRVELSWSS